MKQRFLSEFFEQIAPFRHLWRSAHFVGYAGLIKGVWILFGGRVVFSPESIDDQVLRKLVDFENFFAFVDEIPASEVDRLLPPDHSSRSPGLHRPQAQMQRLQPRTTLPFERQNLALVAAAHSRAKQRCPIVFDFFVFVAKVSLRWENRDLH